MLKVVTKLQWQNYPNFCKNQWSEPAPVECFFFLQNQTSQKFGHFTLPAIDNSKRPGEHGLWQQVQVRIDDQAEVHLPSGKPAFGG